VQHKFESRQLERVFALAIADMRRNIRPYRAGLLERNEPVLLAGESYDTPWTRDAAINTWNGLGLLEPIVARNTLLSVLERTTSGVEIAGQYWDRLIWAVGAWELFVVTGDREFLEVAFEATVRSLEWAEHHEFDADRGLFRGPAMYGDGVAAYPDVYTHTTGGHSSILEWTSNNRHLAAAIGTGLPMHALSTNCVYVRAYDVVARMAQALTRRPRPEWSPRRRALAAEINRWFWMPARGHYRYLVDPVGDCDVQEGFGHAFVILFGIAGEDRARSVVEQQFISAAGIPCLWPCFDRYRREQDYGRHSGTVWPPIQGFWAEAVARLGRADLFARELVVLARNADRDGEFVEIYHPDTGHPYGGLQERTGQGISRWEAVRHQAWSATAFLRMILLVFLGMRFEPDGLRLSPVVPAGIGECEITGLPYRTGLLDIAVRGPGGPVRAIELDGRVAPRLISPEAGTRRHLEIITG
jgi:glycogen debranching enzyme